MTTTITRLRCKWDNRPGVEPGWYIETFDGGGNFAGDSQKVWFPVQVDEFGPDQEAALVEALREAFPSSDITIA